MEKLKEAYRATVGLLVIIGVFSLVFLLYFMKIPAENANTINQVIGIIVGMAVTIISYEFGSSRSSQDKTQLLLNSQPPADDHINTP